jgi:hypothetical protein
MKYLKLSLIIFFTLLTVQVWGQHKATGLPFTQDESCEINFVPSTTIADLELFAKCYVHKSPSLTAQSTLQTKQINFEKLALVVTNQEFPTIQNTYRQTFLFFGEFEPSYANMKTNNIAFFEATRNTVLNVGNLIYPGVPIF